jgi:hypothetical protein
MYAIQRVIAALLIVAFLAAPTRSASGQGVVAGTVVDDATGRPLAGALVRISVGQAGRATRTDELGEFRIPNVGLARVTFSVRVLGFEPLTETLDVVSEMPARMVRLKRLVVLDTVRVRAAKQGLFGVVATAGLVPLPKANLMIVGVGGGRIPLDSTGRFFVPIKTVGSYFLRAKHAGYEAQTISVIVSPNEGVEVAFLLDTNYGKPNNRVEMAMKDFDERIKVRGLSSALVSRTELLARGETNTAMALRYARSFANRALRLGSSACVFVDGIPRPGFSLNAIAPEEIEAMEAYGPAADRSKTLSQRWPRMAPCGDTGLPPAAPGADRVQWVTIWLKH